ncbi:MAG: carboxypeptidase regulatory-like domain-containing protein [Gemmatimonas sp.]
MTSCSWTTRLQHATVAVATIAAAALTLFLAPNPFSLGAQTSTGSVRGYVTTNDGAPAAAATISARNLATGLQRLASSNDRGSYALLGLVAGEYEITARRIGLEPLTKRQRVAIGQTITLDFALGATTTTLSTVNVSASAIETRTSEVATNVSLAQIENLPSVDRNFLSFAQLAPGVRISGSNNDATTKTFSAGAQPAQYVNVFIDGASFKSDVLPSGLSGQDASRGNPFPQNAVQEFRVITQNYKAEYQKATSAIITATTKSGSNVWSGGLFGYGQGTNFTALDTFALVRRAAVNSTFRRPSLSRYLAGGSLGGPLVRDKLFLFASYEANIQDRENTVNFGTIPAVFPASVAQEFQAAAGTFGSPFRSNLVFAKLTLAQSEKTSYELSYSLRKETDVRSFGGGTSFAAAENVRNDVNNVNAKRTFANGNNLHETLFNFSKAVWNPSPEDDGTVGRNYFGVGRLGGRDTYQKFVQDRFSLRHDYTYTGFEAAGSHVLKLGGNLDRLNYSATKFFVGNPVFNFRSNEGYAFPFEAQYGTGDPTIERPNTQLGLYIQDDYTPTRRLTFNLGLRWDVESNMFDNDYVTPAAVRTNAAPFNISSDYFSDGSERKPFLGAFQPRVGASLALNEAQTTTVFGGAGIFYDRNNFNNALDERFRLQFAVGTFRFSQNGLPRDGQPTVVFDQRYLTRTGLDELRATGTTGRPEAFLINNKTRPPSATHFNAGVRQTLGSWQVSATYIGMRSKDGFTFVRGNRNPSGSCCAPLTNYANLFLSSNEPKTFYNAAALQVDRQYRNEGPNRWNWGFGLTYTLQEAERIGGDLFSLDYRKVSDYPRTPSANDQQNTVVSNWIVNIPVLGGVQWSGLLNVSSGGRYNINDQSRGSAVDSQRLQLGAGRPPTESFLGINAFGYRNIDMRLRKDIPLPSGRLGVVADLFNAFNYQNLGCFNGFIPTLPNVNANFGRAGCVVSDPRRIQLGLVYDF